MASSAVLWPRSFPRPLLLTGSTLAPPTTAEPCRASMSHPASTSPRARASHTHSMKSTGNVGSAEGSASFPGALA